MTAGTVYLTIAGAGAVLLSAGAGMVFIPAGVITAGALLLGLGILGVSR